MESIKSLLVAKLERGLKAEEDEVKEFCKAREMNEDDALAVVENGIDPADEEENCIWESGYLQGYRQAIEEAKKFRN